MVEVMFGRRAGWLLGALVAGTAFLASAPAQAATGTRVSAFEYDPVTGQLTKEIIEPDQPQFRLETNYTLDAFGNRIAATVSSPATGAAAIAPRTNTASYDAQGRFAVASTNALGHTETKSYDARFGVVTSVTGPNGLTTTWSYDSFGRKVLETRADGTKTKWEYLFCNGVQGGTIPCPAHAVYIVQTTPLAADGVTQNGPRARAYVDALGREVRGETQGFDGNPVYVDTEHDTMGRVYRKSRPYVAGDTPQWTTFTYDAIGRPLSTTEPNGAVATTAYDGLSTTYTDPLGQYRTIVKNSQGWVISVSEGKGSLVATTSFLYDAHGNQIQSTDATGKIATATYDVRGHKTAAVDPDMGSWTYVVDVLGQVKSQTDAKNQTTTFAYDLLGRMIQRVAHDGETATWTYDTATKGIGKIAEEVSSNGFSRTYTYDSLGRPGQVQTTIDGSTYTFDRTYDAHGRLDTVTYPNLYGVRQVYTALGYLQQVENKDTQAPIWTANTVDAEGHITQFTQGNGVVTNRTYEATTGRLTAINAAKPGTPATEVVNLEFAYDNRGNMIWRQDALIERREAFTYDALNRLAEVQVQAYGGGSAFSTQSLTYDLVGNITSKSNALLTAGGSGTVQATATYEYVAGTNRLTRLRNANGDELVTFAYDNNGHITQSAQGATAGADARMFRTYQWTATNLVARVDRGGGYEAFTYGPDGLRFKQTEVTGSTTRSTIYVSDPGTGMLFEKLVENGADRQTVYIQAGRQTVAIYHTGSLAGAALRYLHNDHLGSIVAITTETAQVAFYSYDVWGKKRLAANWDDDPTESVADPSATERGFTFHEHLTVGLIHMNGRIYDPLLARFMSPDPMMQDRLSTQNYGRYTYVNDNPLGYTDPSGYFLKKIGKIFKSGIKFFQKNPIAGLAVGLATSWVVGPGWFALYNSVFSLPGAVVAGTTTGFLTGGIKGAFFGAVSGALTAGIGGLDLGVDKILAAAIKAGLHGTAQGALAAAQGGKFGPAFLSAGFSKLAGTGILVALPDTGPMRLVGGLVGTVVVGGIGAELGGGKFQNGAATAAFVYLFNQIVEMRRPNGEKVYIGGTANAGDVAAGIGGASGENWLGAKVIPEAFTQSGFAVAGGLLHFVDETVETASSKIRFTGLGVGLGEYVSQYYSETSVDYGYTTGETLGLTLRFDGRAGAGIFGVKANYSLNPFSRWSSSASFSVSSGFSKNSFTVGAGGGVFIGYTRKVD